MIEQLQQWSWSDNNYDVAGTTPTSQFQIVHYCELAFSNTDSIAWNPFKCLGFSAVSSHASIVAPGMANVRLFCWSRLKYFDNLTIAHETLYQNSWSKWAESFTDPLTFPLVYHQVKVVVVYHKPQFYFALAQNANMSNC